MKNTTSALNARIKKRIDRWQIFLTSLKTHKNLKAACKETGFSYGIVVYTWMKNEEFKTLYDSVYQTLPMTSTTCSCGRTFSNFRALSKHGRICNDYSVPIDILSLAEKKRIHRKAVHYMQHD